MTTSPSETPLANPATGEVIDVAEYDDLGLLTLRAEMARLAVGAREVIAAIETDLMVRMDVRGQSYERAGSFEVRLRSGRSRVWDPDDTEAVVRDLVGQHVIEAADVTELIKRDVKVDGRVAQTLLGRLSGEPRLELERCYKWVNSKRSLQIDEHTEG
jgi:hypothetical protein